MDLTLAVKVSSPELRRLTEDLQRVGLVGGQGMNQLQRGALGVEDSLRRVTRSATMVEAIFKGYLLYRGFTFLKNQAVDFTRSLVDLEHQLGLVQAQLGRVGFDARPMAGRAIFGIGQATGRGLAELAKVQTQIISANIDLADSFGILDRSARAAVAGGLTDATLAFDAALSQVNAFNLGVDSFNEVFDKQFNLVRRGVFTYQQFATVVGTVSESFASMGQDIDTANASLAAISQIFTGPQLERGATGLRNAVLRLGEAREDFEALGVAVTDTEGDFRNFIDVGRDLDRVLAGMSEADRFAAIKGLFPDERERRGMEAFLDQLDQAEEFLVEQRFAIGDLDAAFRTVNESTLQQARILRNDLTPALEPVVGLFGAFFTTVNRANDALPGFTQNVIQLAVAFGALRAAQAYGTVSTPFLGPARGPMGMRGIPTGLGLGLGAGALALGASSGATQGFSLTGLLGNAGTGALVGAGVGGGPAGAAIGALAGGLAFAIGSAFERKAPEIGTSFADAFTKALKERSGDVGQALSEALAVATGGVASAERIAQFEALAARGLIRVPNVALGPGSSTRTGILSPYEVSIGAQPGGPMSRDTLAQLTPILLGALNAAGVARQGVLARTPELSLFARSRGLDEQAFIQEAVEIAVREAILKAFGGEESIGSLIAERIFALPGDQQAGGLSAVLGALPQGLAEVDRALRAVEEPVAALSKSLKLFEGDAEAAASVFETMGSEGAKLADQFREFARVMNAQEMLKAFQGMKVGDQGFFKWLGVDPTTVESIIGKEAAAMLAGPDGIVTAEEIAQAFLHPLEEAGDAVDEFANRIRRNTLQIEEIQKRAAMQGRGLTAEEFALIRQLDYASTLEEIARFNQQTGGAPTYYRPAPAAGPMETVTMTGFHYGGASTGSRVTRTASGGQSEWIPQAGMAFLPGVPLGEGGAFMQGGFAMTPQQTLAKLEAARIASFGRLATSQVDLQTLRRADSISGGMVGDYGSWRFSALLQQMVDIARESARRGGQNNYFYGDTVPSELDMQTKRLRDLGPVLVRNRGRSR
jgi:hypothetical protein